MKILSDILEVSTRCIKSIESLALIDRRQLHALWEEGHLSKLLAYLKVDCVFDIGANEGQYAKMLRTKAGFRGQIFSFEPNPAAAAAAKQSVGADDKWMVEELAISEKDGVQKFNVMAGSQFSSFSIPRHDQVSIFRNMNQISQTFDVRTENLATTFHRLKQEYGFRRPFLKMDTQGFDVRIFKSAGAVMEEFVGLQSELAVAKLYVDSVDFREAISEYERGGFSLSAIVPNNAGHFPRLLEMDCIMIRADLSR